LKNSAGGSAGAATAGRLVLFELEESAFSSFFCFGGFTTAPRTTLLTFGASSTAVSSIDLGSSVAGSAGAFSG
jgi:hypothetical protein